MILYFDNLITDEPLIKGLYNESTERRKKTASNYKLPSRLDVALYSLSSYAHIKWSSVIIKYDLADKSKINYFESFVKSIFPNAIIIRGRSDTQQKFQETIKLLETLADPWVFYVGNVDHPIISPSKDALEKLSRKLFSLDNKFTPISAYVSHCFEVLSMCEKNSVVYNPNWKKIEEDEDFAVIRAKNSLPPGMCLINISLLKKLAFDFDYSSRKIVRITDGIPTSLPEQYFLLPKFEVCEHFDGYSHSNKLVDMDKVIPPLFIPSGFFSNSIKISAYYSNSKTGFVNINPMSKDYTFVDLENGTDLKVRVSDIPFFWKNRISEIDTNKNANIDEIEKAYVSDRKIRRLIWLKNGFADSLISKYRFYSSRLLFYVDHPDDLNLKSGSKSWQFVKTGIYKIIKIMKQ